MSLKKACHYLGGEWIRDAHATESPCFDPATGEPVASVTNGGAAEATRAVELAREAFETTHWAHTPRQRAAILLAFAERLEQRASEIAHWLTLTSGKLLRETTAEVGAGVSELRYYAGLARNIFGRHTQIDVGKYSILSREPLGVAAIITPWNAPVTLLIRSLAPAMAAGCTSVVKGAHQTAVVTDMVLDSLYGVPGLPPGVVQHFHETGSAGGEVLTTHPYVDVVSFTGSTATGKRIMAAASGTMKRLSLELGGKAPSLVFEDADIAAAVAGITAGVTRQTGQMCIAVTRAIVLESVARQLRDGLCDSFEAVIVGPGLDPSSQMAPLIDRPSRDRVMEMVETAASDGRVVLPARIPGNTPAGGAFMRPAITEVQNLSSPHVQAEIFGPVLNIEVVPDEATAISRANATRFGLAASLWTRDLHRASRVSRRLRAGTVWVNSHGQLAPELETGGSRDSGLGRLHGVEGLNEFLETKHIYHEDAVV
jgi:betaine-aldehyde dehydrogenase